jgi:hypothetical protein
MVSLSGKFPFGLVDRSVPLQGSGMTCAGCDGGLDGDVAVLTEADHAIPGSAGSRQEDGQKDGPYHYRSLSKTSHVAALLPLR